MPRILVLLTFAILALHAPTALAANDAQTGTGSTCDAFNAGWSWPRNPWQGWPVPPLAGRVDVEPATGFRVGSDAGVAYVDFFDARGNWVGWSHAGAWGEVPRMAAFGVVCVGTLGAWPEVPAHGARWTYQDGFEP